MMLSSRTIFISNFRPIVARPSRYVQRAALSSDCHVSYKVGFMFPGQGAQVVGMGKAVAEEVPAAKDLYDRASRILGYDLYEKCVSGPKADLDSTVISQPAIFVSSMACVEKLRVIDPGAIESCTVTMGLSLGEYSALCFAGAFSFEDGVRLTKARGEAMQAASDASPSGMVAIIGLDSSKVQKICDAATLQSGKPISIANFLGEKNYAISGAKEACQAAIALAPSFGSRMTVPLSVAGAFHTSLMQPAVASLKEALDRVNIAAPRIPVVSNVDARARVDPHDIRDSLLRQVTHPVQWEMIIGAMVRAPEFQKAYELGPGTVCKGLVKRHGKQFEVISIAP